VTSVGDGIEREVKLEVDDAFELPPLVIDGGAVIIEILESLVLDATYHDAADLRLLGVGITVRRRTGEGTRWTVKFPTAELAAPGGVARREIDVMVDSVPPPEAVIDLVASHLDGARLEPVVRLVSQRARRTLSASDGRAVGEIDDDRVTVFDPVGAVGRGDAVESGGAGMAFREVELEFGPDTDPGLVQSVVAQLIDAGAIPARSGSKLAHGLALLGRVPDRSGTTGG
jgi:inorganic triphosphatase YgiF